MTKRMWSSSIGTCLKGSLIGLIVSFLICANKSLVETPYSKPEKSVEVPQGSLGHTHIGPSLRWLNASQVTESCAELPRIKPASSVFFTDSNFHEASSLEKVEPPFKIGTYFEGQRVSYHMGGDVVHFNLLKEKYPNATGIVYDIGANQGFYTYFLAALGFDEVHAFEIMPNNFGALQHGILYNTKKVADRVRLYPMGVSSVVKRMSTTGNTYAGYLQSGKEGNLLSVSFDCFAYHTGLPEYIPFVKIDVEGFEIDVLRGTKQSLFETKIGALLIEVGPDRWGRAGISLDDGIEEMKALSKLFEHSSILVRDDNDATCTLAKIQGANLADSNPRIFTNKIFRVSIDEFGPLMTEMQKNKADCNFWFTNK